MSAEILPFPSPDRSTLPSVRQIADYVEAYYGLKPKDFYIKYESHSDKVRVTDLRTGELHLIPVTKIEAFQSTPLAEISQAEVEAAFAKPQVIQDYLREKRGEEVSFETHRFSPQADYWQLTPLDNNNHQILVTKDQIKQFLQENKAAEKDDEVEKKTIELDQALEENEVEKTIDLTVTEEEEKDPFNVEDWRDKSEYEITAQGVREVFSGLPEEN